MECPESAPTVRNSAGSGRAVGQPVTQQVLLEFEFIFPQAWEVSSVIRQIKMQPLG
jgi:hypothetical protein